MIVGVAISLFIMTALMIGVLLYTFFKEPDAKILYAEYLFATLVVVVFAGSLGWLIQHFCS